MGEHLLTAAALAGAQTASSPAGSGIPEYTVATVAGMIVVALIEVLWWRTGVFRSLQYWLSIGIVLGFQILVDGYLTKLSAPLVIYAPEMFSGIRFPLDIPIEDFGFGWAMVTLAMMLWIRFGRRSSPAHDAARPRSAARGGSQPGTVPPADARSAEPDAAAESETASDTADPHRREQRP